MAKVDINSSEFKEAVLRAVAEDAAEHKPGAIVSIDHAYYNVDRQHHGRWGVVKGIAFVNGAAPFYKVDIGTHEVVAGRVTLQHPPR